MKRKQIMSKVWFITGAGSGIGTGIAKAALRAGDQVVATGRNLDKVRRALHDVASENLEFVQLDVADEAQAKVATENTVKRFGRINDRTQVRVAGIRLARPRTSRTDTLTVLLFIQFEKRAASRIDFLAPKKY